MTRVGKWLFPLLAALVLGVSTAHARLTQPNLPPAPAVTQADRYDTQQDAAQSYPDLQPPPLVYVPESCVVAEYPPLPGDILLARDFLGRIWFMRVEYAEVHNGEFCYALSPLGLCAESGGYLGRSWDQLWKGNYSDNVTALGTVGQVGTGLLGVDLPGDIRDVTYDLTHWEWSWGHAGQTVLDAVGLLPVIGALKYVDEVAAVVTPAKRAAERTAPIVQDTVSLFHQGTLRGGEVSSTRALSTSLSSDLTHYNPAGTLNEFQVPRSVYNQWYRDLLIEPRTDLHLGTGIVTPELRVMPPASGQLNQYLVR